MEMVLISVENSFCKVLLKLPWNHMKLRNHHLKESKNTSDFCWISIPHGSLKISNTHFFRNAFHPAQKCEKLDETKQVPLDWNILCYGLFACILNFRVRFNELELLHPMHEFRFFANLIAKNQRRSPARYQSPLLNHRIYYFL
jgi:hypothetical protein